ncbi:hypothetical protein H8I99_28475, partial [Klebsiella pneumoniae]|nr:hypothetical protein [Klebsiella pneumoniae]
MSGHRTGRAPTQTEPADKSPQTPTPQTPEGNHTMRRTTLIAAAVALLCSAPAFAGDLMTGGIPLGNASNLGVISNT